MQISVHDIGCLLTRVTACDSVHALQVRMQAVIARPVACRAQTVAFQPQQALRPRLFVRTARRSVLVRADPVRRHTLVDMCLHVGLTF